MTGSSRDTDQVIFHHGADRGEEGGGGLQPPSGQIDSTGFVRLDCSTDRALGRLIQQTHPRLLSTRRELLAVQAETN